MKLPFVSSRESPVCRKPEPKALLQKHTNFSTKQTGYGPPVSGGHSTAANGPTAIKATSDKARRTRS